MTRTSLPSGSSFDRALGWLGDTVMEDASIPTFCVSTSLTDGVSMVHRAGPLGKWLHATAAIPGLELLMRVRSNGDGAAASLRHRQADIVLRPAVENMALFGWDACDDAIVAGRRVVEDRWPEIRAVVEAASHAD